ncbi:hypothetical protein ZWY2020_038967 [Hordeum vulgare]|nr:hypothetical protein ZWY2020_038967 [Hordeum vulgare]
MADHDIHYELRTAINSQVMTNLLVDWAETQLPPPPPDSTHWRMHFDGSKMWTGLGADIVLSTPKGDQLKYALQIHFAATNDIAEYEALAHGLWLAREIGIRRILCFSDSDLMVQQVSGEWDARDANTASYRFLIQQLSDPFEGCEFHHVPLADKRRPIRWQKLAPPGRRSQPVSPSSISSSRPSSRLQSQHQSSCLRISPARQLQVRRLGRLQQLRQLYPLCRLQPSCRLH